MGSLPPTLRWSAAVLVVLAAASCSPGTGPAATGSGATPAASGSGPLTAEISQFRDNYSKRIVEIQLTNTTGEAVTVLAAGLRSPLFADGIHWTSAAAGTELPPGQTKSLPARLPAAACPDPAPRSSQAAPSGSKPVEPGAVVEVRVAAAAGIPEKTLTAPAADPFGVLPRNNAEMCVAQAAAAVAGFRLSPSLEVSADARAAVLHLVITPRNPAAAGGGGTLTIDSIGGTTLLEEDTSAPWPSGLRVDAAGPVHEVRLGIRPARCDPHAVAEDKVGTLIPVQVTVGGRRGTLKIDAGSQLRGRIYDFVTSRCGRQ
ncbi:hypothetical protein [Arthrobacter sp. YAF16]|uniref:hypothetical protein n=1 Tax=Arthrobacter sp. YAF16 TaxID=3233076 RepID=UPI003F905747